MLLLAAVLLVSGCAEGGSADAPVVVQQPSSSSAYHGVQPPASLSLTTKDLHTTFHSSQGGTTTLADLQQGHWLLVYFGYTHCPDVCPTTMADLAAALTQLPAGMQGKITVVFLTTDPDRDSPAVMRAWLANFDGALAHPFVGLTASNRRIDAVARSLNIDIEPPVHHKDGSITVQHGAEVLAFVHHDARLLWTAGTSADEYAADLTRLVPTQTP